MSSVAREYYNRMTPLERVHFAKAGGIVIDRSPPDQAPSAQTITRERFDAMPQRQRADFIQAGGRVQ